MVAGAKLFAVLLAMAALPALTLGQINVRSKAEPAKPAAADDKKAAEAQSLLEQIQREIQENSIRLKVIDAKIEPTKVPAGSADEKLIKEIEARIAELNRQLQESKARKQAAEAAPTAQPPAKARVWTFELDGKKADVKPAEPKTAPRLEFKISPESAWRELLGGPLHFEVGGQAEQPKYKVIGPDGKEIKGAKVVPIAPASPPAAETKPANPAQPPLVEARKKLEQMLLLVKEPKPADAKKPEPKKTGVFVLDAVFDLEMAAPANNVIPLSRATYNLPKDKAEALAAFLKANVKTSVLELKVDNNSLTITTAPEAQVAIGNFVKLLQGPTRTLRLQLLGAPDKK
jgi:hypothetical protein